MRILWRFRVKRQCQFSDQQPRHAGSDPEGLCEAAFHLHTAAGLRSGRGEDHYLQGEFLPEWPETEMNVRQPPIHWPVVASLTLVAGVCFLSHCPVYSVVFLANRNPTWSWTWTVSLALPSWTFSGRAAASQGKLSQLETELEAPIIVRKHWVDLILLYYLLHMSTQCVRTLFYSSNMKTIACAISNCDDSHHNVPDCLTRERWTACRDEADEFVEIGALNGIFVLGRSMGFIGESCSLRRANVALTVITNWRRVTLQDTTWTRRDWSRACTATPGTTSRTCSPSTCPCDPQPGGSPPACHGTVLNGSGSRDAHLP